MHGHDDAVGHFASAGAVGMGILMVLLFIVMPWLFVLLWLRKKMLDGKSRHRNAREAYERSMGWRQV